MKEIILAQIAGARASLEAAEALVEAWVNAGTSAPAAAPSPSSEAPADGVCRHPESRRKSVGTMTHPNAWMCLDCEFEHKEGATHV